MPPDGADGSASRSPDVAQQLAEIADGIDARLPESIDTRSLAAGLRLGIERPTEARRLLERLESDAAADGDEGADASIAGDVAAASMLLARSAAMSLTERAEVGPDVVFGWAARLSPAEILAMGRVVGRQLAAGESPDIGRGLGLAWDAGLRIPQHEREAMLGEFAQLHRVVGGVLVGRDLAAEPAPRQTGLGALLGQLMLRTDPADARAAAAIDSHGEAGRRGLVAAWNAWVALRYRAGIPEPTFTLLTRAWTEAVSGLPDPTERSDAG